MQTGKILSALVLMQGGETVAYAFGLHLHYDQEMQSLRNIYISLILLLRLVRPPSTTRKRSKAIEDYANLIMTEKVAVLMILLD